MWHSRTTAAPGSVSGTGLVREHAEGVAEAADQVAFLEGGDHARDGELAAAVRQADGGRRAGDDLDQPLTRRHRDHYGVGRVVRSRVERFGRRTAVLAELAEVHAEVQAGLAAGEGQRLVETGQLGGG